MENKNLLTMKQPALGKKIFELRKQKGLTQEELVEKCNINVRTIQRIEAGETTPRSFTIKVILEALDTNIDESFLNDVEINSQDKKVLNLAWVFGIVYFVFGFIEAIADVFQFTKDTTIFNNFLYTGVKVVSALTFVFFFRGFLKIAKLYSHKLLKIIVLIFMVTYVLFAIYDVFLVNLSDEIIAISIVVKLLVFGIVQIIFGISLLQLKQQLGTLIQVNGIVEIVTGICLTTVILATLGLFLLIPTIIIEVIVLYKLAKK